MSIILDAGALVALERGDPRMWAIYERERAVGRVIVTHAGIVGQVWRGGRGRQARLAGALSGIDVRALDDDLGRRAGVLLGRAGASDVIDAALVVISEDGDEIYTGDAAELQDLASTNRKLIDLIEI